MGHDARELWRRVGSDDGVDQSLDVNLLESAAVTVVSPTVRSENPPAARPADGVRASSFVPIRADDAERGRVRRAHDVTQHEQGRLVGPMQVVAHKDHRPRRRRRGPAARRRFRTAGIAGPPDSSPAVREDRGRGAATPGATDPSSPPPPIAASCARKSRFRTHTRVPAQRFDKRLIRDERFLVATTDEDGRRRFGSDAREFRRQSRLADAGLAGEQDQLTATAGRSRPHLSHARELALAAEKTGRDALRGRAEARRRAASRMRRLPRARP